MASSLENFNFTLALELTSVIDVTLIQACQLFLKSIGAAAMIGLFFWQASVAVDKFQTKLTSLQERLEDSGTLLYPSITFCPKYIWEGFPGVMEILNNNKSMDFYDIKNFAQMNYWTRRKVFSFVSHQNVIRNKSFPCNTVGGSKTGKPCSFPFIYQSIGKITKIIYNFQDYL